MTTQHPEALRLADELDAVPETGADPQTIQDAAAELRRQHARIAELEAQLEAIGASAGSEPVAWTGGEEWEQLAWHLCAEENGEDACDEVIWEGGPIPEPWGARWLKYESDAKRMIELVRRFYAHHSPPGGMAGWKLVPVEPTEEMLAAAHDGDREYTLRNFGDVMTVMQGPYDHWAAMIDAAPPPPTTSAGSGKGE